ncbi:MAG: type II secretion system protein GspE [Acidimicrobiia bacterium]|nr:type II secretion system protein GspE [Acidimicrobiia bacterium]
MTSPSVPSGQWTLGEFDVDPAGITLMPADTTRRGAGDHAPVVSLVSRILASAVQKGASDIHIEPYDQVLRVRFRIDGVLYPVLRPPVALRDAIVSRIKIMAHLDIAERRLPQDGRITVRVRQGSSVREVDFRVSCLPTLGGETVVLRLLDRAALLLDLQQLGFEAEALARYEAAIARPWGLVLVTGPTGSGKTSTLYASIARLDTPGTNILTAEDPVEFNLAGVNQLQVRDGIGLTFAAALRSFLRQDPNVILVGEIRDTETASMAVRAALTGHLVLSTLHTNDAPGTITRLTDMGVEPYLVSSSLALVCAQRLVRRICLRCAEPEEASPGVLAAAGFGPEDAAAVELRRGRGCESCNRTGFKGRVGLFEVMEVTDHLREMVVAGASPVQIRARAVEAGMRTLRQSGLAKVRAGMTTLDEVVRETMA